MKRSAFTLIELIITITIFTVIIAAVYSAFYIGIKTWRRSDAGGDVQKVRLGLLKIQKELKDSFFFSKILFKGTAEEITFPLSISDEDAKKIYVITYRVSQDEQTGLKQLIRRQKIFSDNANMEEVEEKTKTLLPFMKSIRFEYAYKPNDASKDFEWENIWEGEKQNKLPSGVRISLQASDSDEIYSKVIFLQQGELGVK
jgi:prepilin-type N-terminal cleavage/methylation domain-containing protein